MVRRIVLFSVCGLVLTVLLAIGASQGRATERDKVQAFLSVTGFDVALESIRLSAEGAPEMLGMQADDFGTRWAGLAAQVFNTDLMKMMALDMLEATLSDDLLNHAAGFYATDLGQRLVAIENASHMVADAEAKQAEGRMLLDSSGVGPDSRLEILQQLTEAVDASGQGVRAIEDLQIRFIMAASAAGALDYEVDEAALRAALREGEDALRKGLRESSLYGAAYTYQSFSDAELRAYRDALRDPRMQRVYELMNAIQHEVTANRFEALARRLAEVTGGEDL